MAKTTMSFKSIRWLVAETLVVVLGILIALGLDGYRTGINERRLAIEYVGRIQDDLDRDLRYIAEVSNPRIKLKRESLDFIAPVIRGQSPVPTDRVAFLISVSLGGIQGTSVAAWYSDTTFQDMRATGNLRLIQDAAIRTAIAGYYEMLESEALRLETRFTNYASFVHSVMPSELREGIDSESLEQFGTDFALERLLSGEFRALLNQEYNLMLFMERLKVEESASSLYDELESYRISLESR